MQESHHIKCKHYTHKRYLCTDYQSVILITYFNTKGISYEEIASKTIHKRNFYSCWYTVVLYCSNSKSWNLPSPLCFKTLLCRTWIFRPCVWKPTIWKQPKKNPPLFAFYHVEKFSCFLCNSVVLWLTNFAHFSF